jgi:gluconokinase
VSDTRQAGDIQPSRFFVFMGVCGAGKSTVAAAVAGALSGRFLEADDLHPPQNVKAMSEGRPLTDEERWPWLQAVCEAALELADHDRPVMIACSALARRYRDFIRARLPDVIFVHLVGSPGVIRTRMMRRQSHFMSPDMLESQLATLEAPRGEPDCHSLDVDRPQAVVIAQAVSMCRRHAAAASTETRSAPTQPDSETGQVVAGISGATKPRENHPTTKHDGGQARGEG